MMIALALRRFTSSSFGRRLATSGVCVGLAAGLLSGCGFLQESAEVRWTIAGMEPADACAVLGDTVVVKVTNRTTADAEGVAADPVSVPCTDGVAEIGVGTFATVIVELMRGETVVGIGGPMEVRSAGGAVGAVNPLSGPIQLRSDIEVTLGFLDVAFTGAQMSCADAGVDNVTVRLRRELTGLDFEEVWEDPMQVSCEDGLTFDMGRVGSTYRVLATSTVDGREFGTPGDGLRVQLNEPITSVTANLIDIEVETITD